jgi:N6-L-threonylcarbamoyladenine synthase
LSSHSNQFSCILAIESSCDDTAVAIVQEGRSVLANTRRSQTLLHASFGGVIPESAAREHSQAVNDVLQEALDAANCTLSDIDAFSATLGPGLIGSLLVGVNTAKALSLLTGKPFLGVNHLRGHVASNYLESDLSPPFLCLLVSGGHTQLLAVDTWSDCRIVGQSLDDAVGEVYDKVARTMALPYPGGPEIDHRAGIGNRHAYKLPIARTEGKYDFSFSGLKTATIRCYEKAIQSVSEADLSSVQADIAAAFQHAVSETLYVKATQCAEALGYQTIAIAGGVSANRGLRKRFQEWIDPTSGRTLFVPKLSFCTDNAAMIASAAYFSPLVVGLDNEVFSRSLSLSSVQ